MLILRIMKEGFNSKDGSHFQPKRGEAHEKLISEIVLKISQSQIGKYILSKNSQSHC